MYISRFICIVVCFSTCVSPSYASVTAEIIGTPPQINAREHQSQVFIIVKGGALTNVKCWISALIPERGDPAPLSAVGCSAPAQIEAGKLEQLTLSVNADQKLKRGNYTATLQFLGLDPTGASVSQSTTFKVVVPAVSMKLSDTDTLRIKLIRRWPFSSATEAVPVAVKITSDLLPTVIPSVLQSELYVPDGTTKDVVPGGYLKGAFCIETKDSNETPPVKPTQTHFWQPKEEPGGCLNGVNARATTQGASLSGLTLQLEPSVPSSIKEATSTLHLQSTEFPGDLDIPVSLLVKDWWGYAALAVFLGQLLSFSVSNWVSVGRRRKLNELALWPLESRLVNLLLTRPDLNDNPEIAGITSLLDTASQANKLSDVDTAMSSIKNAQDKLSSLTALPVPVDPPQPRPPQIYLLQKDHAYAFRRLHFVILNPSPTWLPAAVFKWEWQGHEPEWKPLFSAQNLRDIVTRFDAVGTYTVRLTVGDVEISSFSIRLEKDKSSGLQWEIAQADKAILLLAVVFAAILSYLAIDQLQTFGTVSDYALAFLGGFGLSATTSGFSAVLSRFGVGSQGSAPAKA